MCLNFLSLVHIAARMCQAAVKRQCDIFGLLSVVKVLNFMLTIANHLLCMEFIIMRYLAMFNVSELSGEWENSSLCLSFHFIGACDTEK